MSLPPNTDPEHPEPQSRRSLLAAIGWSVATAVCAGGLWIGFFHYLNSDINLTNAQLNYLLPDTAYTIAGVGAVGGLLGGVTVGFLRLDRCRTSLVLGLGGATLGGIGGGLTLPTVLACREWLSPVASSTVLWGCLGFLAGCGAYWLSRWMPATSNSLPETEHAVTTAELAGTSPTSRDQQLSEALLLRLFPLLLLCALVFWAALMITTTRY